MKCALILFLAGVLLVAGGCSSSNPPNPGGDAAATQAAGSSAPPPAPTPEIAKPLVVKFVEGVGPLKEFSNFLKMQPNSAVASPTVIIERIQVDAYDSEKQCFPVEADLVMAKRMPDGNVYKLSGDGARGPGFPPIPGTWKFSFKASGNGQWQVELGK